MTVWPMILATVIVLFFLMWRARSREFRERSERPKFHFLENLGLGAHTDVAADPTTKQEETNHEERDS
jgi:hypothetical protein